MERLLEINIFIIPKMLKNLRLKKMDENQVLYLTETTTKKTPEGIVMDNLGLNKICCRRHFLTHVDIV